MKKNSLIIFAVFLGFSTPANAKVELNIYNSGQALIKDSRKVNLKKGAQQLNFTGVAANITPQSAIIMGEGVQSVEQNYDYNLINQTNLLNYNLGKKVKTITTNADGKDVIKTAEVVAVNYDTPVLKFDYGYETNFNGRIVFDDIPSTFTAKPSFYSLVESASEGLKDLSLVYLASGLRWTTDYVVSIKEEGLSINAWATIVNNSGTDFEGAKIKVISGSINTQSNRPMPMMTMAKGAFLEASIDAGSGGVANSASSYGDYYSYDIENKTSIKNNQTKQVLLFNKEAVKYVKEYQITTPFYIGKNSHKSSFDKQNSNIVFNIKNEDESNLGILLPSGTIRFYEQIKNSTAFLGEAVLPQTTKGASAELVIGQASDLYAKGKITEINKVSDNLNIISAEITFYNSKNTDQTIVYNQKINGEWKVLEETITSNKKDANTSQWTVNIPAQGSVVLTYKVRTEF